MVALITMRGRAHSGTLVRGVGHTRHTNTNCRWAARSRHQSDSRCREDSRDHTATYTHTASCTACRLGRLMSGNWQEIAHRPGPGRGRGRRAAVLLAAGSGSAAVVAVSRARRRAPGAARATRGARCFYC
jgi:hypothetical protein